MYMCRNLESCVEELRNDVVAGRCRVVLTDVEAMMLALGHIGRSLSNLKGKIFHYVLSKRVRHAVMLSLEAVSCLETALRQFLGALALVLVSGGHCLGLVSVLGV